MNYAIFVKGKCWKVVAESKRANDLTKGLIERNLPVEVIQLDLPPSEDPPTNPDGSILLLNSI